MYWQIHDNPRFFVPAGLALLLFAIVLWLVVAVLPTLDPLLPIILGLTETAASVPTPNIKASYQAQLTQQAATQTQQVVLNFTSTARIWTSTPTSTPTVTPTPTVTFTATVTKTPTITLTPTLSGLALTRAPNNKAWKPIERDFDGVAMVLVPVGCFIMGSKNGWSDETPETPICFDKPFWLDKYEVTQRQFNKKGGFASKVSYFSGEKSPSG